MRPEYSPLCDTDKELYSEYLRACVDHGQCISVSEGEYRCADSEQFNGGCNNVKLHIGGSGGCCNFKGEGRNCCGFVVHELSVDKLDFVNSSFGRKFTSCCPAGWLAGCGFSDHCGCTCGHVRDGSISCSRQLLTNSTDGDGTTRGRRSLVDSESHDVASESIGIGFVPSVNVKEEVNEARIEGDNSSGFSKEKETKTERNRRWRAERKELKKKRQAMNRDWRKGSSDVTTSSELRETLEKKWKFQNLLAAEKAERDLKVLQASDIEQEKRRYRTKVSAATERNMVSIEKTHAMLRQTGNVSGGQGGGFAETIVSGVPGLDSGSGTISPDSSASMAEFRACQKALLDSEKEIQEYKRKIKIAIEKYGFPLEQVDYLDKEIWTDTQTNEAILDELYPNGYGKDTSLFDDGRFRAIGV